MIERSSAPTPKGRFSDAGKYLGAMDAATAGALIAASADVSLVVDNDGVILDVAFSDADLAKAVTGETTISSQ